MSGCAVTWLGHSTVAVRLDDVLVLTDPVLRARVAHLRRERAPDAAQLAGLQGVLLSHVHYDHLHLPSLELLDRGVRVLVPRGAGRLLRRRGFLDVREVEPGDVVGLDGLHVLVTPAEHGAVRRLGAPRTQAVGFVLRGSQTVYFAGDTDIFAGMAELAPLDVALLPVAGWGPRLPPGHLDPGRAALALPLLQPRVAIPIHWGTFFPYGLGRVWGRRLRDPGREFAERASAAVPGLDVRVLLPGERTRVACPESDRDRLLEAAL